jgi:predicted nucleic acid-binding protein
VALVVDSGVLYAAIDATDQHHLRCAEILSQAREARVVPSPVLTEIDWLCSSSPHERFSLVLDQVKSGALEVEDLIENDYDRIAELLRTYADLKVGFVDAAVLAVVERLREPKLATLDHRHFTVMRPRHIEALELLPE